MMALGQSFSIAGTITSAETNIQKVTLDHFQKVLIIPVYMQLLRVFLHTF